MQYYYTLLLPEFRIPPPNVGIHAGYGYYICELVGD
jgi:hypothetical protein